MAYFLFSDGIHSFQPSFQEVVWGLQQQIQSFDCCHLGVPINSKAFCATWVPSAPALSSFSSQEMTWAFLWKRLVLAAELFLLPCSITQKLFTWWYHLSDPLGNGSPKWWIHLWLSLVCFDATQRSDVIAIPQTQHQGVIKAHHINDHFSEAEL